MNGESKQLIGMCGGNLIVKLKICRGFLLVIT